MARDDSSVRPPLAVMSSGCCAAPSSLAASSSASGSAAGGEAGTIVGLYRKRAWERRGQNLARQGYINGSLRFALGNRERAVDDRLDLLGMAQLVIPLHELAHHAALVEVLLRPVDVVIARGGQGTRLGNRRAAGGEEDRHVLARGVDQAVDRICRADADVDHHCLRLAGDHGIAVRHGHAHVLVRHDHDLRQPPAELLAFGVSLDDRREIGAAVGEQVFDAAGGEQPEPGFRCGFGLEGHRMVGFHAGMLILSHASPGVRSTVTLS